MSYTVAILRRLSGSLTGESTGSLTADAIDTRSIAVAVASPNTHVLMALDVSTVKVFMVTTDKPCTLYANDLSSGAPSFNIAVSTTGFLWTSDDGTTNPLTADVTAGFYITATGSGTATITIQALSDGTP